MRTWKLLLITAVAAALFVPATASASYGAPDASVTAPNGGSVAALGQTNSIGFSTAGGSFAANGTGSGSATGATGGAIANGVANTTASNSISGLRRCDIDQEPHC